MTIEEHLRALRFRCITPQTPIPKPMWNFLRRHRKVEHFLERANTVFPDKASWPALWELRDVPRMSTLAIGSLIRACVEAMPPGASYVNVGTWHGFSFFCGMVGNPDIPCIGIDNFSEFGSPQWEFEQHFRSLKGPKHVFHAMDYEEYFRSVHRGPIGCYFYDGKHDIESHHKGLAVAEPFLADGAVVIVDDTNDDWPREGVRRFLCKTRHSYETLCDIRTTCNCHPTYWNGLMILRKVA